jgi:hypothetical protein
MEAFIDKSLNEKAGLSTRGRRRGNSQWSASTNDNHRGGGLYEDFLVESTDPFRGF